MRLYFVASNDQFVKLIIGQLTQRGYDCVLSNTFDKDKAAYANVIWVDWADGNALEVMNYVTPAKKILRIHRYEAYTNVFDELSLKAFDHVVFVSDHIKRQVESVIGSSLSNAVVIPNYIDLERFVLPEDKPVNRKIAYAGYLCRKKGIGEIMLIAESFPDYEFHVAGTLQENDYLYFFGDGKPNNLYLYKWIDDLATFYADKTFVLNTSLSESFSVATVEAMLCGCAPIVRNWEGATDLYPDSNIYRSIQDIAAILEAPVEPKSYADHCIEKMNLPHVMDMVVGLIEKDDLPIPEEPTLTVAIVKTRKKYMADLMNSLKMQGYDFNVDILDNMDKEKSIGKCFNELADRCATEWILYVGDDDYLAEDYISSVIKSYMRRKPIYPNTVGLLTATHAFNDAGHFQLMPQYSTGFWKADYVRKERFNESLVRQVDTEFLARAQSKQNTKYTLLWFTWIAGYMYRQHNNNISGNKFTDGANKSQEK